MYLQVDTRINIHEAVPQQLDLLHGFGVHACDHISGPGWVEYQES